MTPEEAVENRSYFQRSAEDLDLLKSLARTLRARRYVIRTEQTYVDWCHPFMRFCGNSDSATWGPADVERFLAYLAADRGVAASTQNQALNALVFLFRHVLERPLDELRFTRGRRPPRMPVVLTRDEIRALFDQLAGTRGQ
ncbi:integron integrase [Thiorhodococcus drewsii AZ1]|uniref:Integron integrase n=1 Tax=Thiorhodococcus drewsii AZ1 TaxID=765913 RepID=G2DZM3_9GAMM|nr:site-specific integrase [Thiorhodococcus drewsii]EGV32250.1 integron integrase [Thiorhodococcus drewsii AZ1]